MKVTNWGNYPVVEASVHTPASLKEVQRIVAASGEVIARGMGRCYGDSSLSSTIISTLRLDHILSFNEQTGSITCESGVRFSDLLEAFVPRGWFLPVTPGTKHITVGGAVASDVHGKNHHIAGSFSNHVQSLKLLIGDGSVIHCSPHDRSDLFWATCGGMGLTGIILEATFTMQRIETAYIRQRIVKAKNIDEAFDAFEANKHWTYSVAWIDCLSGGDSLGRSALILGEHATKEEVGFRYRDPLKVDKPASIPVPFFFPPGVLNRYTIRAFNEVWNAHYIEKDSYVDYEPFFYPLDFVANWNRIYGKRGFTQYQFVLPKSASRDSFKKILRVIAESGEGSFLAVLKLFGKQEGILSFPQEGYTLALDFAVTPTTLRLFERLDAMVLENGGRLYLTKDVRMNAEAFQKGYAKSDFFRTVKRSVDPGNKFESVQSKRLGIASSP
jgi:FAD/FMN-containing dehydrogenase